MAHQPNGDIMKNRKFTGLKSGTPKTTLMDKRVKKPANKTGKQPMVYPKGKHG